MKKRALFITVAIVLIISGIGVILHSEFSKNPKPPQQAETTPQQTEQTEPGSRIFDLNSQIVEKKESFSLEEFYSLVQWAEDIYNNYDKICFELDAYGEKRAIEIEPNHSLSNALIQNNSKALSYPAYDDYLDTIGKLVCAQMRKMMPEIAFTDDFRVLGNAIYGRNSLFYFSWWFTDISQSAYSSAEEMVRHCFYADFSNESPADFDCSYFWTLLPNSGRSIIYYDHETGLKTQVFPTEAQEATLADLKEAYYNREADATETLPQTEAEDAALAEEEK